MLYAKDQNVRHGDINFAPCEKRKGKVATVKKLVVAEGETPGHFHEITCGVDTSIGVYGTDNTYFEIIGDNAVLDHPEHGKVKLVPGVYKTWKEKERDPFLKSIREVRD